MVSNICLPHSPDRELQEFIWAALGVEVFMLAFLNANQLYDLSTAMFVAFGLGLQARGKLNSFYALFTVSCLNRETMPLLTMVFAVFYLWRLDWIRYSSGLICQGVAFIGTRIWITSLYKDNPGQAFYFWPARVLGDYAAQPLLSIALISLCILIAWRIARTWKSQPAFLRCALLVMLPPLIVLHLAVGMAFELRVFAEIFPVVWATLCNIFATARRVESFVLVL